MTTRPIYAIADEINADWKKINYAAKPYLSAMFSLTSVHDGYGADDAAGIIRYFLVNATGWHGPVARRVKAELKAMTR